MTTYRERNRAAIMRGDIIIDKIRKSAINMIPVAEAAFAEWNEATGSNPMTTLEKQQAVLNYMLARPEQFTPKPLEIDAP